MKNNVDDAFYSRADEIIGPANQQLAGVDSRGKVSASLLYAASRFNAWVSACGFSSGQEMQRSREETIDYFCEQYRLMLQENMDDYINKFQEYMRPGGK